MIHKPYSFTPILLHDPIPGDFQTNVHTTAFKHPPKHVTITSPFMASPSVSKYSAELILVSSLFFSILHMHVHVLRPENDINKSNRSGLNNWPVTFTLAKERRETPRRNRGMRIEGIRADSLPHERIEKEGSAGRERRGGGRTGSTFVCISSHNRKRPVASPSQWLRFCSPPPACFPGGGGVGGRGGVERQAPKTAG